jgi:hypothetical protein
MAPELVDNAVYTWDQLGERFGFRPDYLGAAGGMISRPDHDALLIITHPGGARSINYDDYWDGEDLIYTGRGKLGDQQRTGQNRDLGDNRRSTYVFEPSGSRQLRFLGRARTVEEWTALGTDTSGQQRQILRFRLRFDQPTTGAPLTADPPVAVRRDLLRQPRPFDPLRRPQPATLSRDRVDPAEAAARSEKATQDHHDLLTALDAHLRDAGWSAISEIPLAIDLQSTDPAGQRWIFEAKTITPGKDLARVRSALAQLLEYRVLYGREDDRLCLVTNAPIADRLGRVLSALDICVLVHTDAHFCAGSDRTGGQLPSLLD